MAAVDRAGDDDGGEQEGRLTESVAVMSSRPQVSQVDKLRSVTLDKLPPFYLPPGPIEGAVNLPAPSSSSDKQRAADSASDSDEPRLHAEGVVGPEVG